MSTEQKKRICIVRHGFYPEDPRVYKEVRALAESGHHLDVICLRKPGEPIREMIDGVNVYRMPLSHRRGSKLRYLYEYLLSILMMGFTLSIRATYKNYQCIQVNTLPDALVFITLLPKLLGARILLDMHEPTPELMVTKYEGNVSAKALQLHTWIERQAIRYAHQVMTVNDTIRQRFIERGAEPSKIEVVRNVPAENFGKAVTAAPLHAGIALITHGTLQPRYGHHLLLNAMPAIRQRLNLVTLTIAGAGDTETQLREQAASLHCDDIITFTGNVSRERVADLIAASDIGIVPLMPGPFSDLCQPNKLFEYIALNIPTVVARLPAIEESFDDSCLQYFEAGNTADLASKIIELATNKSKRVTLAAQASKRYQQLSWHVAKQDYLKCVEQLIDNPSMKE